MTKIHLIFFFFFVVMYRHLNAVVSMREKTKFSLVHSATQQHILFWCFSCKTCERERKTHDTHFIVLTTNICMVYNTYMIYLCIHFTYFCPRLALLTNQSVGRLVGWSADALVRVPYILFTRLFFISPDSAVNYIRTMNTRACQCVCVYLWCCWHAFV